MLVVSCYKLLYKSLAESVLTFNIVVWYGNLGVKGKAKLARIVGMAGKIVGAKQDSISDLYLTAVEQKTARILDDAKHPLFSQFQKLRSGRRYKVPIARKNVQKICYPKCYFCFKFLGYLMCSPCGFQGSALLTL